MYFTRAVRTRINSFLSFLKDGASTLILALMLVCLYSSSGWADTIYRATDAQGRTVYSDRPSPTATPLKLFTRSARSKYKVSRVIDGDTVVLENNKRVRLLGINTPEIESRYRPAEPGGAEAKRWLQKKLQGRSVYLEQDRQKQDHYKRRLAHLYLTDGEHINLSLVEQGLAVVTLIPPNLLHTNTLLRAQRQAEAKKLGIWSMKSYQPRQLPRLTKKPFGWQRYRVKVTKLKRNRRFSRLVIGKNIDISIDNQNLALFPPLESYVNRSLEVRGWVSRKKNYFSIHVQHPSALVLH